MTAARILVVDDEFAIRRLVRGALERANFGVEEAQTAAEALTLARRPGVELVLLDLGLPDRDGLELIPLIRAMDRSVIVLTARGATEEKVAALDLGADDYVVKPFDTEELLARVRTALRHRNGASRSEQLVAGELVIDLARHSIMLAGVPVKLTPREFGLLSELARHPGKVLTHQHILRAVWGEAHVSDVEYLRVAIRSLRAKLEPNISPSQLIINEPGVGYRLTV